MPRVLCRARARAGFADGGARYGLSRALTRVGLPAPTGGRRLETAVGRGVSAVGRGWSPRAWRELTLTRLAGMIDAVLQ